jgi:hypothetical protein
MLVIVHESPPWSNDEFDKRLAMFCDAAVNEIIVEARRRIRGCVNFVFIVSVSGYGYTNTTPVPI